MIFKTRYTNLFVALIILTVLISACKKNLPFCWHDCADLKINGRVFDNTNGEPFENIPVEVMLLRNGRCFGCTQYKVEAGKTDANGQFNFDIRFDSTRLRDYHLSVRIPDDTSYFITPIPFSAPYSEVRLYDSVSNALQNLEFKFYPKTLLTIRLHRAQADQFDLFSVVSIFDSTAEHGYEDIPGSQFATDTTFQFQTAADIYTKIISTKSVMVVPVSERIDSILCTRNGPNVIDIDY